MTTRITDPLASFRAAVAAARLRLDNATSAIRYNLALADYTEAKEVLRAAMDSLGTTPLAA